MKKIIQWFVVGSIMSLSYNNAYTTNDSWRECQVYGDIDACHRAYGMYCYDNDGCYWMYDNTPV